MVAAYLAGPAKKIPVRQVNRPTETTASWLSFPCCHASSAFSMALSGISSRRLCHTGDTLLLLSVWVDSLWTWGFGGTTPPLNVCEPSGDEGWSGNSQKIVAARKAHIRKARARKSTTPMGEDRHWALCRRTKTNQTKKTKKKKNRLLLWHFHSILKLIAYNVNIVLIKSTTGVWMPIKRTESTVSYSSVLYQETGNRTAPH